MILENIKKYLYKTKYTKLCTKISPLKSKIMILGKNKQYILIK